jgi:hypothetical protein
MLSHRNAKLGLAGRYALVSAIAGGMTLRAAAAVFSVFAGDGAPLVAPLAAGERGGAGDTRVPV